MTYVITRDGHPVAVADLATRTITPITTQAQVDEARRLGNRRSAP